MIKKEFDKKYVGEKIVVRCKTEKLAIEFLMLAEGFGHSWGDGTKYSEESYWDIFKEKTAYYLYVGTYGTYDYGFSNCKIIEYKGEKTMRAREGLFLEIMEKEFGLKKGDKINIEGSIYTPHTLIKDGLVDSQGDVDFTWIVDIVMGDVEIEKVKDTITVINKATGKEIEISLDSAKAMELI